MKILPKEFLKSVEAGLVQGCRRNAAVRHVPTKKSESTAEEYITSRDNKGLSL